MAVEKFLRKTRELDSYGAKFYIVQVQHNVMYVCKSFHDVCVFTTIELHTHVLHCILIHTDV